MSSMSEPFQLCEVKMLDLYSSSLAVNAKGWSPSHKGFLLE